ncbi:MAG TPA: DUF1549 domain-containing protein, partial [Planctomycetota bacterium]|nr:DUF1549 domain-containing protein [Planctomycetota bacterium]
MRLLLSAWLTALVSAATLSAQTPAPPSYNRDVRPILADHCFRCHGPDSKARKAELRLDRREVATAELPSGHTAIVAGVPAGSALLARVTHDDVAERMPPAATKKPLTAAEISTLRAWIEHGADYEPHWSFVAPVHDHPPAVRAASWPRSDLDRFVLARLEQLGLQPNAEADRATWLRRVTHDLTGLPPTAGELDAFLADAGADAFARAVDRLLASPHHAEHMARHWCDVARYGDTHGYHLDNERALWLWRDWVIGAFASNMPFDRFTIEQLAGDLLPAATPAQQIASGFHRNGCTTGEGGIIDEEYLFKYAAERVAVTGTVWLGLTLGCAQCHDHKFDPVSQREFYQLFDFFHSIAENGSDDNVRAPPPQQPFPTPAQQQGLADLDARIAALRARIDAPEPRLDAAQAAWERQLLALDAARWQVLEPSRASATGDTVLVPQADQSLLATGPLPAQDVYEIEAGTDLRAVRALRIEALRTDDGQGPGRFAGNGNFVLTGIELVAGPKDGSSAGLAVAVTAAYADYCQRGFPIANALDDDPASGWGVDGARHEHAAVLCFAPLDFAGGTLLRVTLRFQSQFAAHAFARCRLAVTADTEALPVQSGPWQQLGPFPGPVAEVFGTDYGPEADGGRGDTAPAGMRWTPKPSFVDDRVHELSPGICADYLRRVIDSPDARLLHFTCGSDDGLSVWLDGRRLLAHDVTRAAAPDQEQIEAWL